MIIFEDYDKGVLTEKVITKITNEANRRKIPVTVDPKKKNFNTYKNISLFKPNLHELKSGLDVSIDKINESSLLAAVKFL